MGWFRQCRIDPPVSALPVTGSRIGSRLSWTSWLALAALVLYAVLWSGHRQEWDWVRGLDWSLLTPAHDIGVKHTGWVRFWVVVSFALGPVPLRLLGLVLTVVLFARRQVRAALLVLFCIPCNGVVTLAAKALAGRPRPSTALVAVGETSFPSGHALEAMATALALLTVAWPLLRTQPVRVAAVTLAALSVFTVGAARVALNVHHPSDVIAGWALGYVYFLVCLNVFRPPLLSPTSRRRDPIGP